MGTDVLLRATMQGIGFLLASGEFLTNERIESLQLISLGISKKAIASALCSTSIRAKIIAVVDDDPLVVVVVVAAVADSQPPHDGFAAPPL